MSMKKKLAAIMFVLVVLLLNIGILNHKGNQTVKVPLHFTAIAEQDAELNIYYSATGVFDENHKETVHYTEVGKQQNLMVNILSDTVSLRIDFDGNANTFTIGQMYYSYKDKTQPIDMKKFEKQNILEFKSIGEYYVTDDNFRVMVDGVDPHLTLSEGPSELSPVIHAEVYKKTMLKNIIVIMILDLACIIMLRFRKKMFGLPVELYQNRRLILNLAKNDFKTKFAGSYLGIFWAFVQPIVTVLVYWFVFQVGLRSGNMHDYPFVLWLVAGLVPWFFFQEALFGGTNALIEYSYLVKKVVFKISTLPLVKVISALFVHVFFIVFTLILYSCYGYFPDLYTLQVVYYTFALFVLVLGICYTTSAVVIFFRDLTQIINIVLQVGVWVTPIMWNIDDMGQYMPRILVLFMKANPLYYIVNGYRDALLNKVWFWERFDLTCLYWIVTAAVFALGTIIFKRLKIHFADIL